MWIDFYVGGSDEPITAAVTEERLEEISNHYLGGNIKRFLQVSPKIWVNLDRLDAVVIRDHDR